jgi:predicted glycosyltransferase involved in capsule biosynthesis
LFIGYGLEELEILEYVILKARNKPVHDSNEAKHYLIQGFFTHQTELMHSLRRYFLQECGIELIHFWRDYKDWDQLMVVVNELAKLIPTSDLMYSQEFAEMEGMLDD